MKIYSKKSFLFMHPSDRAQDVKVENQAIVPVPDWVAGTLLFELATKGEDPDITIIETKAEEIAVEKGEVAKKSSKK